MTESPHVLLLFGPTAVGKTAALASLNAHFSDSPIEVISADSRQVYRGLDIGTAKPTDHELSAVPHHLIDILDPRDRWDVGQFVEAADRLVREISARGRLPVISGGTAFYLQGYLFGLPRTPRVDESVRDALQARLETEGIEALRSELVRVDPVGATQINANDTYRILRALEVFHTSGRPLSSYLPPDRRRSGISATVIGLYRDRADLYDRINRRVSEMFSIGLPREVAKLFERGFTIEDPGMQTIGYREFFEVGGRPPWSAEALAEVERRIARNTRRYAKRQLTFFQRIPDVMWVAADEPAAAVTVLDTVGQHLHTNRSFLEHDHDNT